MVATERVLVPTATPAGPHRVIASPFQFGTDGTEMLRVRVWAHIVLVNDPSIATLTIAVRSIRLDGTPQLTTETLTPTGDAIVKTLFLPLDAGYIQTLSVNYALAQDMERGPVYAVVDLVRGTQVGAQRVSGQMLAGYVRASKGLTWPGEGISGPLEGRGFPYTRYSADGGAGADPSFGVPNQCWWIVRAASGTFLADATAVTRFPALKVFRGLQPSTDVSRPVFVIPTPVSVAASGQVFTTWAPGCAQPKVAGITTICCAPLPPDLLLRNTDRVGTQTEGIQGGDHWFGFGVDVEEWLDIEA